MSSPANRRKLAVAVHELVKTSTPTIEHYTAICAALEAVAAQDFGIPITVKFAADFDKEAAK